MKPARPSLADRSPLYRILANTAWLLGGKGFGAVCGLAYLAILTRSLGLEDFGHFSLIFGAALAISGITGVQSWRTVVRYGADHIHSEAWDRFGRLGMIGGLFDIAGAAVGCLIAAVMIYGFGRLLDIDPAHADQAFWFCCGMSLALVSAPTGIVRALHRFDLAVYVEAVVPVGRLVAALLIWQIGPSVGRFLIAWVIVDLIEATLYWLTARRLVPQSVKLRYVREWRRGLAENPGLIRFFLLSHVTVTLDAIVRFGPLLAVGGLVGAASAGLYRLASQITQALGKLSLLLTRVVYAEVSHARVTAGAAEFRKLAVQTSLVAAAAAVVVISLALTAGGELLALVGGEEYRVGAVILVPLAIAASLDLASVAFEPVLHASGRPGQALMARAVTLLVLLVSIMLLTGHEATGIAWAVAIATLAGYLTTALLAFRAIGRPQAAPPAEDAALM
ncbi:lipopolysaccharide biosynthesis protein [Sphingomonas sp. 1P06PA]|uniref:lipopolysaccharide biosynthesis protein n=1 Tax=Sphingomonas sp. 1P06PA TaxID=554121 RepID=UPI0039A67FB9